MYPRSLLDADVKTDSERRVFERLRDGLSDEWEAFYSASWIARDPVEGAQDGEIDFVLCHPTKGLLCLEVKGGGIECQHGEWYRTDEQGGEPRADQGPVRTGPRPPVCTRAAAQASLRLEEKPFIGHALVMPFPTVHQLGLAPDAPREILIDRKDLEDVDGALDRVLAFHRGARDTRVVPGEKGATAVRDVLAPQIEIRVPMAAEFLDEEEALVLLTHEQSMLLARMRRDPRMVIRGCAGSGKTMLAVEHARRLAADGRRVGFRLLQPCAARPPAEDLAGGRGRPTRPSTGSARRWRIGRKACPCHRTSMRRRSTSRSSCRTLWSKRWPSSAISSTRSSSMRPRTSPTTGLRPCCARLRARRTDPVWLFMDDNQRVYESRLDVPTRVPTFRPHGQLS